MSILTNEAFRERLGTSRLFDAGALDGIWPRASADDRASPIVAANDLIERGLLTRWQAQQLLAGRKTFDLGHFRLLERIGEGGMAAVYKARDIVTGQTVALKVIAKELLRQRAVLTRFRREVKAAVAVKHPHVVAAYGTECFDGTHVLIMEFVAGTDLERWQRHVGRLPVDWSCEIIRQAARGLAHIHGRGLVHRDIKSSNLMVVADGVGQSPLVKIVDFGVARILRSEGRNETPLTLDDKLLGTVNYVAPEQASNDRHADHRVDIFSLGCTFYKALTNEIPWDGPTSVQKLLARTQRDAPLVGQRRADIPPALEAVVAKMLARDPHQRFGDAEEVAKALEPFSLPLAAVSATNIRHQSAVNSDARRRTGQTGPEWVLQRPSSVSGAERFLLQRQGSVLIGRGRNCQVRLDDPQVSRNHCLLTFQKTHWCLDDLGSENGTLVNGLQVEHAVLEIGDEIQLGATALHLDTLEAPQQVDETWFADGFGHETVYLPRPEELAGFKPGSLLGKHCELGALFQIGSTGAYYRACDRRTGRLVCVKVFREGFAADGLAWSQFVDGLQMVAKLRHPSIVQLFLAGVTRGRRWLAMEYVEGPTLRQVIRNLGASGPWPPEQVINWLSTIVSALDLIHAGQVPYINVTPESIVMTRSGTAKLVNFSPACGLAVPTIDALTGTCELVDDLAYMAPERFRGDYPIDERCDVYALGACAYALLTGRPIFAASSPGELMRKICHEAVPSPRTLELVVPRALEALVLRCLAKEPINRFQTARELLADLEALVRSGSKTE